MPGFSPERLDRLRLISLRYFSRHLFPGLEVDFVTARSSAPLASRMDLRDRQPSNRQCKAKTRRESTNIRGKEAGRQRTGDAGTVTNFTVGSGNEARRRA